MVWNSQDMEKTNKDFTEIGNGTTDIDGIVSAAKSAETKWLIVEQDECKKDPIESVKISLKNLKKITLMKG